ncbi:MAG TPA: hypothetical protein VKG92_00865 [Flavobacteriales bacterium]|nr:hypothetical protein [Flavobacteriales bacterium]
MRPILFVPLALAIAASGCRKDCEEKGGVLSADERSWFVEPAGGAVRYRLEGTDSIITVVPASVELKWNKGNFEREEHCEWGYQTGSQSVAPGILLVEVEHCGVGVEENLNSARIFGLHFSDYTPQDALEVNNATYNAVYVMPGSITSPVHDIVFSKEVGLIAYTHDGERWLREP